MQKLGKQETGLKDPAIVKEALRWVNENKGYKIKSKCGKFYPSPRMSSEVMDCSMPLTCDTYSSCSLGCLYCFSYFFKSNNPAIKDMSLHPIDVDSLISSLQGKKKSGRGKLMHDLFYSKKFLLHIGGMADPFCYFERVNGVGLKLIRALGELDYPTLFSFKGNTIFDKEYVKLFTKYSKQKNFAFQISMVTYDRETARNVEVGVPPPEERIRAIRMLSEMGYWTILRLRPYIIGVTDESIDDLLEAALDAGINGVSMEFFALDIRANVGMKARYDWMSKFIGVDNLMQYFKELSPSERGGYMRLNRLVKEDHVKKIYKFCEKHDLVFGCSDPDYKELNTSGSCCAMPDVYKPNRGLENWTCNQLTFHLKEARKEYHRTGKLKKLYFGEVYPAGVDYLESVDLTNDHVSVTGMMNAERYANTYRTIIQKHWNNLRSPAAPLHYFNGKLRAIDLDDEGNLIYIYEPKEYEAAWKKEGINMGR